MDINYNDEGSPHRRSNHSADPASPVSSLAQTTVSSSQNNIDESDNRRIRELRHSLGVSDDIPSSVLRAILEANDREASQRSLTQQSQHSSQHDSAQSSQHSSSHNGQTTRQIRAWDTTQSAPSRPGVVRLDIDGERPDVGDIDECAIYSRRVEAVHLVQENLHRRLEQTIDRGEFERMQHQEEEGERRLNSLEVLRPSSMEWEVPDVEGRILRREPFLPPPPDPEEPLPLPESLMRIDGDYELCMGIFVDGGPEEESSQSSWASVTVDETPPGPNEHIVRCYRCRAGLKVNINTGLVICPRCRNICPAADVVRVGR